MYVSVFRILVIVSNGETKAAKSRTPPPLTLSFGFHIQRISEKRTQGHTHTHTCGWYASAGGRIPRGETNRSERIRSHSQGSGRGGRRGVVEREADKLSFRDAREDLRALSNRSWVGASLVCWCSSALRINSSPVSDSAHLFPRRGELGPLFKLTPNTRSRPVRSGG